MYTHQTGLLSSACVLRFSVNDRPTQATGIRVSSLRCLPDVLRYNPNASTDLITMTNDLWGGGRRGGNNMAEQPELL